MRFWYKRIGRSDRLQCTFSRSGSLQQPDSWSWTRRSLLKTSVAWLLMLAGGIARPPERILFAVVLLKTMAIALQEIPELNGFWVGGGFQFIVDLS